MIRKYSGPESSELISGESAPGFTLKSVVAELEIKAEEGSDDDRMVFGYASTFDTLDHHKDRMIKGCYEKSLKDDKQRALIRVLNQHNQSEPIGKPSVLIEDSKGLYSGFPMTKASVGDDLLIMVKEGVITGLSVGFELMQATYKDASTGEPLKQDAHWLEILAAERDITEAKLFEYSLVTWGSNPEALIDDTKSVKHAIAKCRGLMGLVKSGDIGIDAKLMELAQRMTALEQHIKSGTGKVPADDPELIVDEPSRVEDAKEAAEATMDSSDVFKIMLRLRAQKRALGLH
jgi:HK97 family phage prohead protease